MFRKNTYVDQSSWLDSTNYMSDKIRKKLEKSWAPIFFEHVFTKINEEPFAVLYGDTGKPNFPVNIMLSLEYIKHIKGYNDLDLLDAFSFDYLVNYAVGLKTLGELNLAERTLYLFRERVYKYCVEHPDKEALLFGQFIKLTAEFAKIAGLNMDEQRMDTTMLMSNIKKAGRISLAFDVLHQAVQAIPNVYRSVSLIPVLTENFKTEILYRSRSDEKESKLSQILGLVQEALGILEKLEGDYADVIRITSRFLSEQTQKDEATGNVIPKQNKDITSDSLQSAYDEDATFRKKGSTSQSGYVLAITETCNEQNAFQLITDYTLETNITSDVEIIQDRLPEIVQNTGCEDIYVDGGFHSEDVIDTAKNNQVNLHLTNMSGREPNKKLPVSDFDIDADTNIILKCPTGHVPTRAGVSGGQTVAHFPHNACKNCELRDQCQSKQQKKDNVVRITIKSVNSSRERTRMKTEQKENTSKRAAIEGTNSALKRTGLAKLNVRGKIKAEIVCSYKVLAQNIKRFTKFLRGGYKTKPNSNQPKELVCPI